MLPLVAFMTPAWPGEKIREDIAEKTCHWDIVMRNRALHMLDRERPCVAARQYFCGEEKPFFAFTCRILVSNCGR